MKDELRVKGKVTVKINGKVVLVKDNLVVTAGKALIASRLGSNGSNFISYMALGSGVTAPAIGQTALVTELGRVAVTFAAVTDTATFTGHFAGGVATGTINEAGLFNATPAGTMISRVNLAGIPKTGDSDEIDVIWELQVL